MELYKPVTSPRHRSIESWTGGGADEGGRPAGHNRGQRQRHCAWSTVATCASPVKAAAAAVAAWQAAQQGLSGEPAQRLIIVHHDEAFAAELARLLPRITGHNRAIACQDERSALAAARAGATGMVLWFDADKKPARQVLEQVLETRHRPWLPTMLLLPGEQAVANLTKQHSHLIHDGAMMFDRRPSMLKTFGDKLLAACRPEANGGPSARALLCRLRRGFGDGQKPSPLGQARTWAKALGDCPGKAYWGQLELVPHLLAAKLTAEAAATLESAAALQPDAFATFLMRQSVLLAGSTGPARADLAVSLAKAALTRPDLTADRLYRLGERLVRLKIPEALALFIKGWRGMSDLGEDHQLLFLASRYCRQVGDADGEAAYLAEAVQREPLRTEYLDALAGYFGTQRLGERTIGVSRLALAVGGMTAERQARLVRGLLMARKLIDARQEYGRQVAAFPDHPETVALQKLVA